MDAVECLVGGGVINSHAYMLSLLGEAEAHGAAIAFQTAVSAMRIEPNGVAITLNSEDAPSLRARLVVNAPRVDAAPLTHRIDSLNPAPACLSFCAVRACRRELPDGALAPAYSGIRPKLTGPGKPASDSVIQGPATHGARGLINLLGIESPGLTSSLAIAGYVAALVAEQLDA